MSGLCAEFGISRKTGYKIFQRYQQIGVRGLSDRSRRPYRHANQLPEAVEALIVRLKRDRPTGARRRFGSGCASAGRTFRARRSAPSTPCSIATAW